MPSFWKRLTGGLDSTVATVGAKTQTAIPDQKGLDDFEKEQELARQQGKTGFDLADLLSKGADAQAGYNKETLDAYDKETTADKGQFAADAASSMAAQQGAVGRSGGGSGYGSMLQASQTSARNATAFGAERSAERAGMANQFQTSELSARAGAVQQLQEAQKQQLELGTDTSRLEKVWAEQVLPQIKEALAASKGTAFDDEDQAANEIRKLKASYPMLAERLDQVADQYQSGAIDY
jgi:hypothetical protein